MLRRCVRFLTTAPGVLWRWRRQRWPSKLQVLGDTDWAGCPITRRSTSGAVALFGQHLIWASSTTPIPVSLSSGEAEVYGLTKVCSRAIGLRHLAMVLGYMRHGPLPLEVGTDSAAAKGIASRRGWIQAALQTRKIEALVKMPGNRNPFVSPNRG